jgi:RNA 3'-terminal phosphate cyclase (ATP)
MASLLGEDLRITNIRAKRDKPGLRPQHLAAVKACAEIGGASLTGAEVGSREMTFRPGKTIRGGDYRWEIGTAGSTTLLAMMLLPVSSFAPAETAFEATGGLFQDFAPSAHHMQHVLFPSLAKMGVEASLQIVRPGYVPGGGGTIRVKIRPVIRRLSAISLREQGKVTSVSGVALSSHLREQEVSHRMAEACREVLSAKGFAAAIERVYDDTAAQAGASLAVWAETDTGCLLGSDQAGRRGRRSENIGRYVADCLLADLATGATVDRFLADQLIIYAALADGVSEYVLPALTDHVDANLWLVEEFGARTRLDGNKLLIEGIGHRRK